MQSENIKSLLFNSSQFMGDWTCQKHNEKSHILNFCESCHKEEKQTFLDAESIRLNLATIEPYFANKYGINFSIDDFNATCEDSKSIKSQIRHYIADLRHGEYKSELGFLLYGKRGTGKTMLSNLIQYEYSKLNLITKRDSQYSIYQKLLEKEAKVSDYLYQDLLIIEEVGRTTSTEANYHAFFDIIEKRIMKRKVTIMTSNLTTDITKFIDGDRLRDFKRLYFNWETARGTK